MNSQTKFAQQQEMQQDNMGNMTQQSVLNAFDFSAIDEMDPSLGKYLFPYNKEQAYQAQISVHLI